MYAMRWYWDKRNNKTMLKILRPDKVEEIPAPFLPYFYVDDSNGGVEKIECSSPYQLKDVVEDCKRHGIETFEGDIPFGQRVAIDLDLRVCMPQQHLVYDIEVEAGDEFPDPDEAKYRILSICAVDQDGNEFVFCDRDEGWLIQEFLDLATQYRIIGGWNSQRFDWPYIKNRCKWLDIEFDEFQIIDLDFLAMYKFVTLIEKSSFSLGNIAKVEDVGMEKLDVDVANLKDLFENDVETLIKYNMMDAKITSAIEKKYQLINFLFSICQSCNTFPGEHFYLDENGMSKMSILRGVDTIFTKNANKLGVKVPTRKEVERPTYLGGLVMEPPITGIVKNVAILDYSSLYPNIMKALNIGPDTYLDDGSGDIKAPIGSFTSKQKSYVVDTIEELMHLKTEMGKAKAEADPDSFEGKAMVWRYHSIKVLINSLFGATGFFRGRHYKFECCQNVQSVEREMLPATINFVKSKGYKVVGADTDSVFVQIDCVEDAVVLAKETTDYINTWVKNQYNLPREGTFELEVEKYFDAMMIIAKKKYAGVVVHDGTRPVNYLYKRGLESVRHDWPEAVKTFQDKLLLKMLDDKNWGGYINETKKKFYDGELDDRMAIYKTLKKPVEMYATLPPHVRAASMKAPNVRVGDKVGYLKVGPQKTDIVVANDDGSVDIKVQHRSYVWKHMFAPIMFRFNVPVNQTLDSFR